jgi:hypothetical protein
MRQKALKDAVFLSFHELRACKISSIGLTLLAKDEL